MTACGKSEKIAVTNNLDTAYEVVDAQGSVIKMFEKLPKIMTTHFYLDAIALGIVPPERMIAISKTASDPAVSYMIKKLKKFKIIPAKYLWKQSLL